MCVHVNSTNVLKLVVMYVVRGREEGGVTYDGEGGITIYVSRGRERAF